MTIEHFEKRRTVLLLQGPASGLWSALAAGFHRAGLRVIHAPLAFGDRLCWRGPGELRPDRGRLAGWEDWLEALIAREGIEDVIHCGNRLPSHIAAQKIALRRPRLHAWVVELGHLRPDWPTLAPFAMGRNSRFPRDPAAIRAHLAEAAARPFALVALQLGCDRQIRGSSDHDRQTEMLVEEVLGSFAAHAAPQMRLLVKLHPPDSGLIDGWEFIDGLAARLGIADRVTVFRGSNFRHLAEAAEGVVTTSSAAGVSALAVGCPVKVMGSPRSTTCRG